MENKKTSKIYELSDLLTATYLFCNDVKLIEYYWLTEKKTKTRLYQRLIFVFDNSDGKVDKLLSDLLNGVAMVNVKKFFEIFRFLKSFTYPSEKSEKEEK